MKKLIIFLALTLTTFISFADDYDSFDGWSVTIYGLSHHVTQNQSNPYREVNPGVGLRKHFGECFWETANCFGEVSYINNNSLNGKVVMASLGSKWTIGHIDGFRVHVGATLSHVQYENPNDQITYKGVAPIPLIGFGKGNFDFDVSLLSKRPLEALTGKDAKAVYFLFVNYRF